MCENTCFWWRAHAFLDFGVCRLGLYKTNFQPCTHADLHLTTWLIWPCLLSLFAAAVPCCCSLTAAAPFLLMFPSCCCSFLLRFLAAVPCWWRSLLVLPLSAAVPCCCNHEKLHFASACAGNLASYECSGDMQYCSILVLMGWLIAGVLTSLWQRVRMQWVDFMRST